MSESLGSLGGARFPLGKRESEHYRCGRAGVAAGGRMYRFLRTTKSINPAKGTGRERSDATSPAQATSELSPVVPP